MSTNDTNVTGDKRIYLLDELQNLLEKQLEMVQQDNIRNVENLSKQTDSLVKKIAQTESVESAEFKNRREQLQKLYKNLCLAITAQKANASEELSRVRKGKKTVTAYRNSI
jgi:hypothetical protein